MTRRSTEPLSFAIVDVFADEPLTGNPLTLVPDADGLSEGSMRAIAREFNQSETTFLVRPTLAGAGWRLRSFTAIGAEVFGAGHNAMGAWIWLADSGALAQSEERFVQQIGDELLAVQITRTETGPTLVSMDQSAPEFGEIVTDRRSLAGALGLDGSDLDARLPAQVVSTGAGHLLVPVRDRAAVDRSVPDPVLLLQLLRAAGGEGCYVYSREAVSAESSAYARFFNPTVGIAEDPATGTAAGPLVASLVRAGVVAEGTPAIVEQGHLLGRPSRLRVTVTGDLVRLSGSGLIVAEGQLRI